MMMRATRGDYFKPAAKAAHSILFAGCVLESVHPYFDWLQYGSSMVPGGPMQLRTWGFVVHRCLLRDKSTYRVYRSLAHATIAQATRDAIMHYIQHGYGAALRLSGEFAPAYDWFLRMG